VQAEVQAEVEAEVEVQLTGSSTSLLCLRRKHPGTLKIKRFFLISLHLASGLRENMHARKPHILRQR
jgi:hypothetical protein